MEIQGINTFSKRKEGLIMKYMEIKEFVDQGYLQELNRKFLHPLGLALQASITDDEQYSLNAIWDAREDPEGIYFENVDQSKAEFVQNVIDQRGPARKAALGYIIQPVDSEKSTNIEQN